MSDVPNKAGLAPDVAPGFSPARAALKDGATTQVIFKAALRELANGWIARGKVVAGPVHAKPGLVLYAPLASADDLVLEGFVHPANSAKEFAFPRHELLCRYKMEGNRVELTNGGVEIPAQILLAVRPCDAAALPILDHVFNWDYRDESYNRRRWATTVVTLACATYDESCFCTSVGLGPQAERGSDVMLFDLGEEFEVRCLTDKGRALFAGKTQTSEHTALPSKGPERRFSPEHIKKFVDEHFSSPFWQDETLACLGCGACAYNCPTCHCFDIVDEGNTQQGERVRNWDSCQFAQFTLHASGHNPRPEQGSRQRQRVLHKFSIYPDKFGEILCTGCGNCTRNCPEGQGMLTVLTGIERL
ncbi:MAG: 4Fe-4S dicluster domain-containing protein [Terriglobia bacterium]